MYLILHPTNLGFYHYCREVCCLAQGSPVTIYHLRIREEGRGHQLLINKDLFSKERSYKREGGHQLVSTYHFGF